jgi:hypothetical protein
VFGGIYEYTILPPEGGDQLTLNSGNVTVGLRTSGASLTHLPYEIKVDLGSSRAVQSNSSNPSGNGSTKD